MPTNKPRSRVLSSRKSPWPVLDGDPRWEEKLDAQLSRLRTRLQKALGRATGDRKASLVAQMRELREDFARERARLAESEKSGGYVVARSTRKPRPKPAADSVAETIGAALGKVIALLDAWRSDGTVPARTARSSKGATKATARGLG